MLVQIGKITYNNREINFLKATHTNVSREGNGFVRDQFMNDERYLMVFKEAIKQGLMSYGIYSQEKILITFVDSWGLHASILLVRNENTFIVKTMYTSKINFYWKHFLKIHNRINLAYTFTLPAMSKQEYFDNKKKSKILDIEVKSRNEDPAFIQAMKRSGIRKVK